MNSRDRTYMQMHEYIHINNMNFPKKYKKVEHKENIITEILSEIPRILEISRIWNKFSQKYLSKKANNIPKVVNCIFT